MMDINHISTRSKLLFWLIALSSVILSVVLFGSSQQTHAIAPNPAWWQGTICDTPNYPGSYALGTSFNNVTACGPGPAYQGGTDHYVLFTGATFGEFEWECVELSMRYMYLVYGIQPYSSPGGKDVVPNYSGSILTKVANNGTSLPAPGDIISIRNSQYDQYGHTSVVTGVNVINSSGSISTMEQNGPANSNGGNTISVTNNILGSNVTGWLHNPNTTNYTGAIDSQLTSDGVTHVYKGTTDGRVWEISWGNGAPLTQWTPATNLGGAVTSLSSKIISGVQHVYAGVGANVWDISWGNGAPLTQWVVGSNLGATVSGVSSQVINGVQHVEAGVGTNVWDVSWGNGAPLTQWVVGSNLGSAVTTVSSQVTNGVIHAYAGTGQNVWEIAWGNGTPLGQWTPGTALGATVTGLSSQIINGSQHVYAGTGTNVWEIAWGNGLPYSKWTPGTGLGSTVTSLSSQIINGSQHVYAGTGSNVWEIAWGNGLPFTQWKPGTNLGGTVNGIGSLVINGVQHSFASVGTNVWDVSWTNSPPSIQWVVGTGL